MKRITLFFIILAGALLSACGNNNDSQPSQELPELLEVDLRLPEEAIDPGAEIVLEAYVSQGGEAVEDANEVKFEISRQGDEESVMLEGKHQGQGIYTANNQFMDEGTYSITAHVTARDMHNMPTEDLIVGHPSEAESNPVEESSEHGAHDHQSD